MCVLERTEELLALLLLWLPLLLLLLLLLLRVVFTRYETPRYILIWLGGDFFQLDLVVRFRLYVCDDVYSLSNQTNQKKSQIRVCTNSLYVFCLFVCQCIRLTCLAQLNASQSFLFDCFAFSVCCSFYSGPLPQRA